MRLQPDYIVFTSNDSGHLGRVADGALTARCGRDLHAVEMGHVVNISDEIARPSVGLVSAIEELARDVHPAAFATGRGNRAAKVESTLRAGSTIAICI